MESCTGYNIIHKSSVGSTNDELKLLAQQGCPAYTVIMADVQTSGKGRLGRSFSSPQGGLYFSVLLRPNVALTDCLRFTGATAVYVSQAINKIYGVKTAIKWVNDIYLGDKKLCGILAESQTNGDMAEYIIIGIGINTGATPDEVTDIADSLGNIDLKTSLMEDILKRLAGIEEAVLHNDFVDYYRNENIVLGKRVEFTRDNTKQSGEVVDITDDLRLVVINDKNERLELESGEVVFKKTHEQKP